ncbi:MAG: 4-alpha-glucanotransferase, partial [Spirochaetaceae bacterium]|nr:4-alpha-glucanotransferase [Spirochaetaceae bacterium]
MSKVKLIFGTSNSVPSGETELLFEDVYQKAFKPFLTSIYNHPEINSTLFYAGPLLEWLERKHPEFHTVLAEMMSRKSIEILGGGFWDPMLPLVPAPDRVGQIEVM